MGLFLRRSVMSKVPFVAPPVSCTATITGDIAAGFGANPADISGLTASKTSDSGLFLASTPVTSGPALPPSGIMWIQVDSFASSGFGGSNSRLGLVGFSSVGAIVGGYIVRQGVSIFEMHPSGEADTDSVIAPANDGSISIGVDSAGNGFVYDRNTLSVTAIADLPTLGGSLSANALAGADHVELLYIIDLTGGIGSASVNATLAQDDMVDIAALSGIDYCGNAIT